ncbi:MAG: tRNA glutamyl-Q(34) synthetase GluQRS [Muribaculaceae bacterium]|nr:tRNA glutamyl-Q(34) synthetase GluQRS [Muribaculaceae bacterium]
MKGRFAPSPSGRMHLGNIYAALLSWLSVRKAGGKWVLRIEDLDPQRSKEQHARMIEDDLQWLGLDYDEGGYDACNGLYRQSNRHSLYLEALKKLNESGLTYPCTCTRAEIMATQAPHQSDGRVVYSGKCRPQTMPSTYSQIEQAHATRLYVPDKDIEFCDTVFKHQQVNLANECGDFILRRADGAWAYQLAVVVDDAAMGITEVARGCDLLISAAQQSYIYSILGLKTPQFAHFPLLVNESGQRLSKRDKSLSMEHLRTKYTPQQLIGHIAHAAHIIPHAEPCEPRDLIQYFSWERIPATTSLQAPLL